MNNWIQSRAEREIFFICNLACIAIGALLRVVVDRFSMPENERVLWTLLYVAVALLAAFLLLMARRRLHDLNMSASWLFVMLIPVLGWLLWPYLILTPGSPEPNRYGPRLERSPKEQRWRRHGDTLLRFWSQGRLRRSRFFVLHLVGLTAEAAMPYLFDELSMSLPEHAGILGPAMFLSMASIPLFLIFVARRRLHDLDRSGTWLLLLFVPVVGLLLFLYLMFAPGSPGANRYGEADA